MLQFTTLFEPLKFGNSGNISYIYSMNKKPKTYGFTHEIPVQPKLHYVFCRVTVQQLAS